MHQVAHVESHFTASELVRDIVIGMSDGLTVPFALAAGSVGNPERDHRGGRHRRARRDRRRVDRHGTWGATSPPRAMPNTTPARNRARKPRSSISLTSSVKRSPTVFREYGLEAAHIEPILQAFEKNHPAWVDFMMRFELGLEEPDPRRALQSASAIAGAYIAGGMIPLAPYMVVTSTRDGLFLSVVVTAVGAGRLRLHQGPFHRHASDPKRPCTRR